jgi:Fic family protein
VPPPFKITDAILGSCGEVMRLVGRYEGLRAPVPQPLLRKRNRIRTIRASLAIEGNALSQKQVTAVLDGKRVAGSPRDILEAQNAVQAYAQAGHWKPGSMRDLLAAHRTLMKGLIPDAGRWRAGGVGVFRGDQVVHMAPPSDRVEHLVTRLMAFVRADSTPWLVKSAVAHYELQFIHPFSDGNGRIGRLWQHVVLEQVSPVFAHVPVESAIRENQREYYRVLKQSDREGASTRFIEFSLRCLEVSLRETLEAIRPERADQRPRVEQARASLRRRWFSRKDYLNLFPGLSTATASRDLAAAVTAKILESKGSVALSRYRFR